MLTRWQKIRNLQTQARVLVFLQRNDIGDVAQLAAKVTKMHEDFSDVSNRIKAVDRRMDTLATHLAHYDSYKKHIGVYKKYQQLSGKKGDAFYDKHFESIQAYEAANDYLKKVLNGRTTVPLKTWQKEQETLTAERWGLCERYYQLGDDTKAVEALQRSAERIMREDEREQQPQRREWDKEL